MKTNRQNQTFYQWAVSLTEFYDTETIKEHGDTLLVWFEQGFDIFLAAHRLNSQGVMAKNIS